jgi:hypothetical protein
VLSFAAAGVAWVVVILRARPSLAGPPNRARRALWVTFLTLALGWTVRIRSVYAGLDRVTGTPNLAQLLGDLAGMVTGLSILMVLRAQAAIPSPHPLRRPAAVLAGAAAVLAVGFVAGPFGRESTEFATDYARQRWYWGYQAAYLAYLGAVFTELTVLCRRFARLTPNRLLSAGLHLTAVGGSLGLAYVVLRAAYIVAAQGTVVSRLGFYSTLSQVLIAAASVLAIAGVVLPTVEPRLARRRLRRTLDQLNPLWDALETAGLLNALPVTDRTPGHRERPADLHFALHRRVVEIRDGLLALRPWLSTPADPAGPAPVAPEIAAPDRRSRAFTADTSSEAARIAAALRAYARGIQGRQPATVSAPGGAGTFADEVSWLRAVSVTFGQLQQSAPPPLSYRVEETA